MKRDIRNAILRAIQTDESPAPDAQFMQWLGDPNVAGFMVTLTGYSLRTIIEQVQKSREPEAEVFDDR